MPLNPKTRFYLRFRDQRGEKYDRRALQFRISLDLRRYLATVHLSHHYVEQNQIRLEALRGLVGLGGKVLFRHEIPTRSFEKDFDQVSAVRVVIDNQNSSPLFDL